MNSVTCRKIISFFFLARPTPLANSYPVINHCKLFLSNKSSIRFSQSSLTARDPLTEILVEAQVS